MFKMSQADSPIHLVPWRLRCCQCMLTGNQKRLKSYITNYVQVPNQSAAGLGNNSLKINKVKAQHTSQRTQRQMSQNLKSLKGKIAGCERLQPPQNQCVTVLSQIRSPPAGALLTNVELSSNQKVKDLRKHSGCLLAQF